MIVWYYFNDIYPPLHDNHSPLDPPSWWIRLIEGRPPAAEEEQADEDEPSLPVIDAHEQHDDDRVPVQ